MGLINYEFGIYFKILLNLCLGLLSTKSLFPRMEKSIISEEKNVTVLKHVYVTILLTVDIKLLLS